MIDNDYVISGEINKAHIVHGGIMGISVGVVSSGITEVGIARIGYFIPMDTVIGSIMIGSPRLLEWVDIWISDIHFFSFKYNTNYMVHIK